MAEPKFVPKPGQVDFTHIRYSPVVNTIVTYRGKVLLVQRSPEMRLYPNYWNGISGFLDDAQDIEDKVREELHEELGVVKPDIASLHRGALLLQEAPQYNKTWLVVPYLATVRTAAFRLDWEAARAQWFTPDELKELQLLPGFGDVLRQFFPEVV